MTNDDWMRQANCLDVDPEIFFPSPPSRTWGGPYSHERVEAVHTATSICSTCPVTAECLAYAQRVGATTGIWAGLDFDNPELLRRRLRRYA